MRIYNENSEIYIHSLSSSISKDPASLENWRCLHIQNKEGSDFAWYDNILIMVKELYKDADCDIVHCSDNDVLFISKNMSAQQLYELADEVMKTNAAEGSKDQVVIYDLFRDWHAVRDLLLSKNTEAFVPVFTPEKEAYNFGEISALQEVFDEAKKLRKSRMPLHVMIVEDDPLTRRIVSNGFKENYALITAENAQEAIANYLLHAPDIVFLDIGLPDTSGFNVLRQIMTSDPDAYVVMFSANSYLDNINAALKAGAAGFIAKPFRKEKMQHYINDSALHHRKYA